jgi:hypothetical protein
MMSASFCGSMKLDYTESEVTAILIAAAAKCNPDRLSDGLSPDWLRRIKLATATLSTEMEPRHSIASSNPHSDVDLEEQSAEQGANWSKGFLLWHKFLGNSKRENR